MFDRIGNWLKSQFSSPLSDEEFQRQREEVLQKTPVPVIWLFGKTGSGKSTLVRHLTGVDVRIGVGFRPETRQSSVYDFPSADHPVLQFIDTRGLGEAAYDPGEDVARFNDSANLLLVTARAVDNALDAVLSPLRSIRRANPERPVLLALTCLHEAYPQRQHPHPDPFRNVGFRIEEFRERIADGLKSNGKSNGKSAGAQDPGPSALDRLTVALRNQVNRFEGLVDGIVPLDLTLPEDGFDAPDFGGDRLKAAMVDLLPDVYRQTFLALDEVMGSLRDMHEKRAMPFVLSAASMSATAASVPVPWIDLPVVAGIQSEMIRRISRVYNQPMDLQQFLKIAGAVGGPALLRQFFRETLKAIPGVGSAANAAFAFATTFSLGKACCWYFGEILAGHAPTAADLRKVMSRQMDVAKSFWNKREEE